MVDKEMLSAISELLDEKLDEKLEQKFDEKLQPICERLDGLEADVSDLKTDVRGLKDEMRYIRVVQLENNVIPRLSTIESCYLDTFDRYRGLTDQFDKMSSNIEVLNNVVAEHSSKLEKISG